MKTKHFIPTGVITPGGGRVYHKGDTAMIVYGRGLPGTYRRVRIGDYLSGGFTARLDRRRAE